MGGGADAIGRYGRAVSIDWGDVPTWVAGAGAFVALVFARRAANSASEASTYQAEQIEQLEAEVKRRDQEQKRNLASKVEVYIRMERRDDRVGDPPRQGVKAIAKYINTSGMPIYDASIFCFTPSLRLERYYHILGPDEKRDLRLLTERLEELLPVFDSEWLPHVPSIRAACAFRDAEGLWWTRIRGMLERADGQEEASKRAGESQSYEQTEEIGDAPGQGIAGAATRQHET